MCLFSPIYIYIIVYGLRKESESRIDTTNLKAADFYFLFLYIYFSV
jgi:hypothetical protein